MNAFALWRVLKNSENTKNLWADKRISHSEMLPFLKANLPFQTAKTFHKLTQSRN